MRYVSNLRQTNRILLIAQKNTASEADENPWTDRENLELLRLHRDLHSHTKPDQMAEALHDKMSRIRYSSQQSAKQARTGKEFMSQVRDLKKLQDSDELIAELEDKFERPEPPAKKRKAPRKKQAAAE